MSNEKVGLSVTAFEPSNLDQAISLADKLARSGLIPTVLRGKPQDILLVMMKGRELGWSTMRSLSHINIIQGKPVIDATGLAGLVQERSDICEYLTMIESTPDHATYETKRRGQPSPVRVTYTLDRAKAAGLTTKDNWKRMPTEMLRSRAVSELARMVYPDVLAGAYSSDEIQAPQRHDEHHEHDQAIDLTGDPHDMNPETGEVPMLGEKSYAAMSTEEKVAYWTAEFEKAPNDEVLATLSKGMAQTEPDGSPVRDALKVPYLAMANKLRAVKS